MPSVPPAEPASPKNCPACGQPLGADGACYVCILKRAVAEAQDTPDTTTDSLASGPHGAAPDFSGLTSFGDYQLHDRLGEGAMGVVFRATKRSLKKTVAIKFIKAGQGASPRDRALFLREAELASRLDHPNIVTVSEVGERDGLPFLVMRCIEGRPLSERLLDPGFIPSPRDRVRLLVAIALAVHHAHQRGVIHRDLKPGNILINAEGIPFVTDFGLARWVSHQSTVTFSDGQAFGTPAFMPPEQAHGKRADLTTSGDIWSLGVMLYHLLSGRLPFDADSMPGIIRLILEEEPPRLFNVSETDRPSSHRTANPLPRLDELSRSARNDLESICLCCLQKSPGRRYPTAAALAEDLERWLEGKPVAARPVSGQERILRWIRRHPAMTGALVASSIAIAAITWSLWQRGVNARTAELGRLFNYVADMNLAQRGLMESNHVLFARALAATAPAPGQTDLRGIEWGLLKALQAAVTEPVWFDAGEPVLNLAVHPRHGLVAAIGSRNAFLLDPAGVTQRTWSLHGTRDSGAIAFSPADNLLAFGTSRGLELGSLDSDQRTVLTNGAVSLVTFSHDGRFLAASIDVEPINADFQLLVFDVPTRTLAWTFPVRPSALNWSQPGPLRFANDRAQVHEWLPENPAEPKVLNPQSYRSPFSCLSHSGRFILRTSLYGVAHVLDLASATPRHTVPTLPGESVRAAFATDDSLVAITTVDGAVQVIPVETRPSGSRAAERNIAPGHAGAISAVAFAHANRSVLTASRDGTIRKLALDASPAPAFVRVENHLANGAGVAPIFSVDSKRVALLDQRSYSANPTNGGSLLWDTEQRRIVGRVPTEIMAWGPHHHALSWARDGQIQMWDLRDPSQPAIVASFRLNTNHHTELDSQLAGKGRWIVSISKQGAVEAFDVRTLQPQRLPLDRLRLNNSDDLPKVDYLAASPDTAFAAFAVTHQGTALWDIERNRVVRLGESIPNDMRFSPLGRYVAITDFEEHRLRLYDGRTGERLQGLTGHLGPVAGIGFSADARQLVTGGEDSNLVVWNLATGREVLRRRLDAPIYWLRVSPDSRWLATGHLPTQFGSTYDSLGLGHYEMWPLPRPDDPQTPSNPASSEPIPDSVWTRFQELARLFPP